MPKIVINRDLLFYTITAPVGSPRLQNPPPNNADDVLLIQYIFHKFLTNGRMRPLLKGALIDDVAMDGVWGMRTDYVLNYFMVTLATGGIFELEAFSDLSYVADLRESVGHRIKPINQIGFGIEQGDRKPMSRMSSILQRCEPQLTVKNPILYDMPPRLQTVLKANMVVPKASGGGGVINAPSA